MLHVDDVDVTVEHAIDARATHFEDVSPAEIAERATTAMAGSG